MPTPAPTTDPRGARTWLPAVLVAVVGTVVVVVLYDRGVLPIAGPFVLLALLPLLIPLQRRGQRRLTERRADEQGDAGA
ncbi:hypothetical protein [Nocardioides euryhalodurans]|uniref:Uncharacterized protein n=1 Tax=Nocardioides euryhalodurans TaxID=2518370 RepID=A0A4P7GLF6_9ACTN|nr:hypothetical protein [Nocardioides euryhalodurans]QBR92689.1 hypothetical protein EXE57_10685 [Nocardioides euryhalodurans]